MTAMTQEHTILTGTDAVAIRKLLEARATQTVLDEWICLYESIWHMTYANATDMDEVKHMDLAEQIVLMNQQEDLLPNPLSAIEEVTALDLGGFPDAVLFPELLRYTHLKKLDLWENGLTEIPLELFDMTSLEELRIIDPIRHLPEEFVQLTHLKKLCIEGDIASIPEAFKGMEQLQSLELDLNNLTELPAFIVELPQLKRLNLSYNTALQIPPELIARFKEKGIRLEY
jgi:leucine-rich repeat protein SHOC2